MPLTFRSGLLAGIAASLGAGLGARAAQAQETLEVVGRPVNGETGFQFGATELARDLQNLDFMLLVIISAITLFVTVLLAITTPRWKSAGP